MGNNGALVINGFRIDQDILRKKAVRKCSEIQCLAACCSDGVWLLDNEAPRILEWADEIKACLPPDRHDESKWFEQGKEEMGTIPVNDPVRPNDTCCVFLQPDRKCALQVVSSANNLGWPGIKPFYCTLYPLYTEDHTLLLDNITHLNVNGAMCRAEKPLRLEIYKLFPEEITLVLGKDGYQQLCDKAEAQIKPSRKSIKKKPAI
jgi:hypothetical protein